jgi:hypothetical protein
MCVRPDRKCLLSTARHDLLFLLPLTDVHILYLTSKMRVKVKRAKGKSAKKKNWLFYRSRIDWLNIWASIYFLLIEITYHVLFISILYKIRNLSNIYFLTLSSWHISLQQYFFLLFWNRFSKTSCRMQHSQENLKLSKHFENKFYNISKSVGYWKHSKFM